MKIFSNVLILNSTFLVSSVLFMALFGELVIRCFFHQSRNTSVSPERNMVT